MRSALTAYARTILIMSGAAIGTSGCTLFQQAEKEGTKPVPLDQALHQLQLDLSRVDIVVPSSLLLADPNKSILATDEGKAMLEVLANSQCFDIDPTDGKPNPKLRHRDPLVPVATGPLQVTVQGQLSEAGTFTISVTPSAGGTVTRQAQQQVMVPMTLVSLVTLPSFYVGQQTSNIQYVTLVDAYKSADPKRAEAEHKQIADYISTTLEVASRLTAITTEAVVRFEKASDTYCNGKDNGGATLIGPAEPKPPAGK